MNYFLDILNNPNEVFENDFCIIDLKTEHVTWKPGKFTPKMANDIEYWFEERRKLNASKR